MDDREPADLMNSASGQTEVVEASGVGSSVGSSSLTGSTAEMISRYNHCGHCGANLHFRHQTDFSRNLTEEFAQCPECGTKARNVMHRLQ